MFSFRTTPLGEQLDKALYEGLVGCFCTPNCWNNGKYVYDIFKERGNLKTIFRPSAPELSLIPNHIEFTPEDLNGLQAIVVEIQDAGSRYFNYSRDVFRLMEILSEMGNPPSLYIVDHVNPAGRVVEGTMPSGEHQTGLPKVAHRHGLTLGELCHLYLNELGAKFALHVISAAATDSNRLLLPWTIAPAPDIPGLFTCDMYSGGALWNATNICPAIGTSRPYEYIGAPFISLDKIPLPPVTQGVIMRPASFIPSAGIYAGKECSGYQIILEPGSEYHSLMHTLLLFRHFKENCSEFKCSEDLDAMLADENLSAYIEGKIAFDQVREHIKVEEQKWIRKAKKFVLYEEQPYRMK